MVKFIDIKNLRDMVDDYSMLFMSICSILPEKGTEIEIINKSIFEVKIEVCFKKLLNFKVMPII